MRAGIEMSQQIGEFLGDLINNHRIRQVAESIREQDAQIGELQAANARSREIADNNAALAAGYAAVSQALVNALKAARPAHPLTGEALENVIRMAGLRNFEVSRRVDSAMEAGAAAAKPYIAADAQAQRAEIEALTARLRAAEARVAEVTRKAAVEREDLMAKLRQHHIERVGYREVLRGISPQHPIVVDEALRSRMVRAAEMAYGMKVQEDPKGDHWPVLQQAATELLREQMPQPPLTHIEAQLVDKCNEWEDAHSKIYLSLQEMQAQRGVFRSELGRLHPTHPLVTDAQLRESICAAATRAFALAPRETRWKVLDTTAHDYWADRSGQYPALALINAAARAAGPFRTPEPAADPATMDDGSSPRPVAASDPLQEAVEPDSSLAHDADAHEVAIAGVALEAGPQPAGPSEFGGH